MADATFFMEGWGAYSWNNSQGWGVTRFTEGARTLSLGEETLVLDFIFEVTGNSMTFSVGTVSVIGDANVDVTGIALTLTIGPYEVPITWHEYTSDTKGWTALTHTSKTWTAITSDVKGWTEITPTFPP